MKAWQVIVGNVGTVYYGPDESEARASYGIYVAKSRANEGRVAGEAVTLMYDGDIVESVEYV